MKATSFGAAFLLWATPLVGQQSLTLTAAVRLAEQAHPSVAAAEAAVARAASGTMEARAALLPVLALDASGTRFAEPMVVAPLHGFDPTRPPQFDRTLYQGGLSLTYTLFDGGARGARIGRAARLEDAAGAAADATRQALAASVAGAYLRVLAQREQLAAQRARALALRGERGRAGQLFEQGRAAHLVALRAEAALTSAAADTVQAAAQLDVAERSLARLLGLEAAALRSLALQPTRAGTDEPPARDAAAAGALERNAEVARARAQLAAAERGAGEARALWLPRLQLGARYVEYGSGAGREAGEWQTGVQLGYPLFTGGARGAAQDRAHAEIAGARAELRAAELRVAEAVDAAISAWEAAHARTRALRDALEQAEEVVRIEKLALDQGAGTQTDYLGALAELLRTRSALTEARYASLLARIELARVTGQLTVEWLGTTLESGR